MRKLNKLIRNENGSITMFVTLSVLFLIFVLVGIYANYANKLKAQEDRIGKIQNNYGQYASDEGMDKLYIKQTQTEEDNKGDTGGDAGEENVPQLPAEYQQVEYIESTGTQYIDTGVIMTENIQLELDFQITQVTDTNREVLTGAWDNNLNGFLFGIRSGYFQYAYAHSEWNGSSVKADCERHKIIVNKNGNALLDDVVLANVGSKTLNSNTSIYLCNTNIERSWNPGIKTKIFNAKIYNNSILIRDFIPCYRKSDNKVGLYDLVENKFYTNEGTGDFTSGPDVNGTVEDEVVKTLPSEYQQVEYIESTGTQYIDTGVVCNENLKIEVEYKISSFDVDRSYIFGVYGASNNYRVQYSHANVIFAGFGNMYSDNITAPKEDKKYNLIMDNGKFTLDGEVIYDATSAGGKYSSTNNATITLFARNGNGSIGNYSLNRIYSCKMSIGENEVRNLVPCYRKIDNVAGMYDTVKGVFYKNLGKGDFLKGPHADGTTEVEYIQSTGTQYIDSGVLANNNTNVKVKMNVSEIGSDTQIAFGSRTSYQVNDYGFWPGYRGEGMVIAYGANVETKEAYPYSGEDVLLYTDKNKFTLESGSSTYTKTINYNTIDSTRSLIIFGANIDGNVKYCMKNMKLYYFKIYEGDTLVRDYIPVLDKEGIACLYDKVEAKYYYNEGTGIFSYK